MKNENITYGFEIETEINTDIINILVGHYHAGLYFGLPNWRAEQDGSLRTSNVFKNSRAVEIVSKKLIGRSKAERALKDFVKHFSLNNTLELNKILNFNDSTGSHIHFSFNDFDTIRPRLPFELINDFRNNFFNRLKKAKINSNAKELIITSYNRRYSKVLSNRDKHKEHWRTKNGRYSEINFHSEEDGQGLEWRSITLRGIKTWAEFLEAYRVFMDSIEYLRDNIKKWSFKRRVLLNVKSLIPHYNRLSEEYLNESLTFHNSKSEEETLTLQNKFIERGLN